MHETEAKWLISISLLIVRLMCTIFNSNLKKRPQTIEQKYSTYEGEKWLIKQLFKIYSVE